MEEVISERALDAFLEECGMVERVWEMRDSHADIEVGSVDNWCSRDLRVC